MREYGKKTKLKSRPAKKTKPKKGKKVSQRACSRTSSSSELDWTLPEGNHLDSFDIFRSNQLQ